MSEYSKPAFSHTKVDKLTFFKDHIIVSDMKFDQRITAGGIITGNRIIDLGPVTTIKSLSLKY